MRPIEPNEVLDKDALAEALDLSGRTIERLVKRRKFPRPFYVGRKPHWQGKVVTGWMENRQHEAMN